MDFEIDNISIVIATNIMQIGICLAALFELYSMGD